MRSEYYDILWRLAVALSIGAMRDQLDIIDTHVIQLAISGQHFGASVQELA